MGSVLSQVNSTVASTLLPEAQGVIYRGAPPQIFQNGADPIAEAEKKLNHDVVNVEEVGVVVAATAGVGALVSGALAAAELGLFGSAVSWGLGVLATLTTASQGVNWLFVADACSGSHLFDMVLQVWNDARAGAGGGSGSGSSSGTGVCLVSFPKGMLRRSTSDGTPVLNFYAAEGWPVGSPCQGSSCDFSFYALKKSSASEAPPASLTLAAGSVTTAVLSVSGTLEDLEKLSPTSAVQLVLGATLYCSAVQSAAATAMVPGKPEAGFSRDFTFTFPVIQELVVPLRPPTAAEVSSVRQALADLSAKITDLSAYGVFDANLLGVPLPARGTFWSQSDQGPPYCASCSLQCTAAQALIRVPSVLSCPFSPATSPQGPAFSLPSEVLLPAGTYRIYVRGAVVPAAIWLKSGDAAWERRDVLGPAVQLEDGCLQVRFSVGGFGALQASVALEMPAPAPAAALAAELGSDLWVVARTP